MSHSNPNDLDDGMIVRAVARPTKTFRVSGEVVRGRATFVAMSPGTRTVMNGNARNYRPETPDEAAEREGVATEATEATDAPEDDVEDENEMRSESEDDDETGIAELVVRMQDAVARVADGDCDAHDAAAIVSAAAALNEAVVRREAGEVSPP